MVTDVEIIGSCTPEAVGVEALNERAATVAFFGQGVAIPNKPSVCQQVGAIGVALGDVRPAVQAVVGDTELEI